jgi:polygalacturonase
MMRSFTLLAVALPLLAVLACENPETHSCASVFTASTALVTSFCATYTASNIAATKSIPSAINSACSGKSLTISEACTCFVTPTTTPVSATVSASDT